MPSRPRILRTVPALRRALSPIWASDQRLALVPTMGALHDGHLSLVRAAKRRADRVAASIFVNPTQFAPTEDFSTYPRNFDRDIALLDEAGVDFVWAPSAEAMYPEGFATRIVPAGPAIAGLEDKFRPHFFAGVATVVAKLLLQCRPDVAMFGEKDFQQLRVVTQLAKDLDQPVRIFGVPIRREADGLALSSRNAYLSAAERTAASTLYLTLRQCADAIAAGKPIASVLTNGRRTIRKAGFALDYLEARHAKTLAPVRLLRDGPIRLLVAARIGRTRLIDNVGIIRGARNRGTRA